MKTIIKNPMEAKRYGRHNLNLKSLPTITKLTKKITNPNNPRNKGIKEYPKYSIRSKIIFSWKKFTKKKYAKPNIIKGKTKLSVFLDLLIPSNQSIVTFTFPDLSIWKRAIISTSRINKSISAKSKLANTLSTISPNPIIKVR